MDELHQLQEKVATLEKEKKELEEELKITKEHLKRYTCPARSKLYYEKNKELQKQKSREYKQRTNYHANLPKEKKKQYARTAYLNKKAKLQRLKEESEQNSS
jgi:hypothetical protein